MIQLLLVTPDPSTFVDLAAAMKSSDVVIDWADSGARVLEMLGKKTFHLVVADEDLGDMTGLELISRLVTINPMINCAAVSSLSGKAFHEASEGLGILMPLPSRPSRADGQRLIAHLNRILGISIGIQK